MCENEVFVRMNCLCMSMNRLCLKMNSVYDNEPFVCEIEQSLRETGCVNSLCARMNSFYVRLKSICLNSLRARMSRLYVRTT